MGHRGNILIHENGQTFGCAGKGFIHDLPTIVVCGPAYALAWARDYLLKTESERIHQVDIWDEGMTEGAVLINLDSKDLIFGSWEWLPDYRMTEEIPYEIGLYSQHPDISRALLELVQSKWQGWTVTLALPAEFATQETLLLRGQDLARPLITDTYAPESGLTKIQISKGFQRMFEMTCEPLRTALRGLQI